MAWVMLGHHDVNVLRLPLLFWYRSMKKDAKLKEKKSKAWKQRQGEQKQAQAKKQKRYAAVELGVFSAHVSHSMTYQTDLTICTCLFKPRTWPHT